MILVADMEERHEACRTVQPRKQVVCSNHDIISDGTEYILLAGLVTCLQNREE